MIVETHDSLSDMVWQSLFVRIVKLATLTHTNTVGEKLAHHRR